MVRLVVTDASVTTSRDIATCHRASSKDAPQRMMRGLSQLSGTPLETGRHEAKRKFFFMQRSLGFSHPMKVEPMRHLLNVPAGGVDEAQSIRATSMSRPARQLVFRPPESGHSCCNSWICWIRCSVRGVLTSLLALCAALMLPPTRTLEQVASFMIVEYM